MGKTRDINGMPENQPLKGSKRSTRTMDELASSSRTPIRQRAKKLTAQRYELISDFLKTVALKDVNKYGGTGEGKEHWFKELLERLNRQGRSRGVIKSVDLNSWLENENLAKLVGTLEESTEKPGSIRHYSVTTIDGGTKMKFTRQPKDESYISNAGECQGIGLNENSLQAAAANPERVSSSGQTTSGYARQQKRTAASHQPKKLTDTRRKVITTFFQKATERMEVEKYARHSARDSWKGNLLQKLNQLPASKRKGCAIAAADLEHWLRDDAFQTSIRELQCAIDRMKKQTETIQDAVSSMDEDMNPDEKDDVGSVAETPAIPNTIRHEIRASTSALRPFVVVPPQLEPLDLSLKSTVGAVFDAKLACPQASKFQEKTTVLGQVTETNAGENFQEEVKVKVLPCAPLPPSGAPLSPNLKNYFPDANQKNGRPRKRELLADPRVQNELKTMKDCTESLRSSGQNLLDFGFDPGFVATYQDVIRTVSSFVVNIPEFIEFRDKAWNPKAMGKPLY